MKSPVSDLATVVVGLESPRASAQAQVLVTTHGIELQHLLGLSLFAFTLCFFSQLCQAAVVANRFFASTLVSVMGCRMASMFPLILPCSVSLAPVVSLRADGRRTVRHSKKRQLMCIIHTMQSRELIKLLQADGWQLQRTRGSHHQFVHPTKPGTVTVPHPKKDPGKGLVRAIRKQAGLK